MMSVTKAKTFSVLIILLCSTFVSISMISQKSTVQRNSSSTGSEEYKQKILGKSATTWSSPTYVSSDGYAGAYANNPSAVGSIADGVYDQISTIMSSRSGSEVDFMGGASITYSITLPIPSTYLYASFSLGCTYEVNFNPDSGVWNAISQTGGLYNAQTDISVNGNQAISQDMFPGDYNPTSTNTGWLTSFTNIGDLSIVPANGKITIQLSASYSAYYEPQALPGRSPHIEMQLRIDSLYIKLNIGVTGKTPSTQTTEGIIGDSGNDLLLSLTGQSDSGWGVNFNYAYGTTTPTPSTAAKTGSKSTALTTTQTLTLNIPYTEWSTEALPLPSKPNFPFNLYWQYQLTYNGINLPISSWYLAYTIGDDKAPVESSTSIWPTSIDDSSTNPITLSVTASSYSGWDLGIKYYYTQGGTSTIPTPISGLPTLTTTTTYSPVTLHYDIPQSDWINHVGSTLHWSYDLTDHGLQDDPTLYTTGWEPTSNSLYIASADTLAPQFDRAISNLYNDINRLDHFDIGVSNAYGGVSSFTFMYSLDSGLNWITGLWNGPLSQISPTRSIFTCTINAPISVANTNVQYRLTAVDSHTGYTGSQLSSTIEGTFTTVDYTNINPIITLRSTVGGTGIVAPNYPFTLTVNAEYTGSVAAATGTNNIVVTGIRDGDPTNPVTYGTFSTSSIAGSTWFIESIPLSLPVQDSYTFTATVIFEDSYGNQYSASSTTAVQIKLQDTYVNSAESVYLVNNGIQVTGTFYNLNPDYTPQATGNLQILVQGPSDAIPQPLPNTPTPVPFSLNYDSSIPQHQDIVIDYTPTTVGTYEFFLEVSITEPVSVILLSTNTLTINVIQIASTIAVQYPDYFQGSSMRVDGSSIYQGSIVMNHLNVFLDYFNPGTNSWNTVDDSSIIDAMEIVPGQTLALTANILASNDGTYVFRLRLVQTDFTSSSSTSSATVSIPSIDSVTLRPFYATGVENPYVDEDLGFNVAITNPASELQITNINLQITCTYQPVGGTLQSFSVSYPATSVFKIFIVNHGASNTYTYTEGTDPALQIPTAGTYTVQVTLSYWDNRGESLTTTQSTPLSFTIETPPFPTITFAGIAVKYPDDSATSDVEQFYSDSSIAGQQFPYKNTLCQPNEITFEFLVDNTLSHVAVGFEGNLDCQSCTNQKGEKISYKLQGSSDYNLFSVPAGISHTILFSLPIIDVNLKSTEGELAKFLIELGIKTLVATAAGLGEASFGWDTVFAIGQDTAEAVVENWDLDWSATQQYLATFQGFMFHVSSQGTNYQPNPYVTKYVGAGGTSTDDPTQISSVVQFINIGLKCSSLQIDEFIGYVAETAVAAAMWEVYEVMLSIASKVNNPWLYLASLAPLAAAIIFEIDAFNLMISAYEDPIPALDFHKIPIPQTNDPIINGFYKASMDFGDSANTIMNITQSQLDFAGSPSASNAMMVACNASMMLNALKTDGTDIANIFNVEVPMLEEKLSTITGTEVTIDYSANELENLQGYVTQNGLGNDAITMLNEIGAPQEIQDFIVTRLENIDPPSFSMLLQSLPRDMANWTFLSIGYSKLEIQAEKAGASITGASSYLTGTQVATLNQLKGDVQAAFSNSEWAQISTKINFLNETAQQFFTQTNDPACLDYIQFATQACYQFDGLSDIRGYVFTPAQEIQASSPVTLYLTINNNLDSDRTYSINLVAIDPTWYSLPSSTVIVPGRSTVSIPLTINVPNDAFSAGLTPLDFSVVISDTSQPFFNQLVPVYLTVQVIVLHQVITGVNPSSSSVYPGTITTYICSIKNTGNSIDIYQVAFKPGDFDSLYKVNPTAVQEGWCTFNDSAMVWNSTIAGWDGVFTLNPDQNKSVALSIAVPTDWAGLEDSTYMISMIASLVSDSSITSQVSLTLTVTSTSQSMKNYVAGEIDQLNTAIQASSYSEWAKPWYKCLVSWEVDMVSWLFSHDYSNQAYGDLLYVIKPWLAGSTDSQQGKPWDHCMSKDSLVTDPALRVVLVGEVDSILGHITDYQMVRISDAMKSLGKGIATLSNLVNLDLTSSKKAKCDRLLTHVTTTYTVLLSEFQQNGIVNCTAISKMQHDVVEIKEIARNAAITNECNTFLGLINTIANGGSHSCNWGWYFYLILWLGGENHQTRR